MHVLDHPSSREPRQQHLVDLHRASAPRQHALDRQLEGRVVVLRREEAQALFGHAEARVEGLEDEAALVLTGDGLGKPGRAAAAAAEHKHSTGRRAVAVEEKLPA